MRNARPNPAGNKRRWANIAWKLALLVAGLTWLLMAGLLALFLAHYLAEGAGLQVWGAGFLPVSSGSLLLGLVHFVGLSAVVIMSLVVGLGLCAYALTAGPVNSAPLPLRVRSLS